MAEKLQSRLKASLQSVARSTAETFDKGYDRLLDRRVCLGVTGFSGSGKSTFITSLIHQLRHFPEATLPAFSPALQGRLLGVEVHSMNGAGQKDFPFTKAQKALSGGVQQWPESTRNLSSCLLELRLKPRKTHFGFSARKVERLFVEIRDYPGEWLLDLPLLGMNFQQWCLDCQSLYRESPRRELLGDLFIELAELDPFAIADMDLIESLHQRFITFLQQCSHPDTGLSLVQPGRFLLSGDSKPPVFLPLLTPKLKQLNPEDWKNADDNSYIKVLEKAYNQYLNEQVEPFYKEHFSGIDRQVVLVDVLKALNVGKYSMEDMQLALTRVLDSFQFGQNSLLSRLFSPRIEKVLFVASKIDQVLPEQHENVRALTAAIVQSAYRKATFEQVDVQCEATASVRATTIYQKNDRAMLQGLFINDDESVPGLMAHPDIPSTLPDDQGWQRFQSWRLRKLLPPANLQLTDGGALPHIRLDVVIRELIGDKC
ncbi:ATPase [Endozoicomonas sp. OPT23]|uniref:YcjX family protein n=1 Tax=Endozoicomonas sp. OPT23 TaxID=2072845 RepID=UPI00129B8754|nr:YcjX family protein [Endozoicomonas sp. OPT23]MRI34742.1 ATPase [Endozoicomonas sp. OPT23]